MWIWTASSRVGDTMTALATARRKAEERMAVLIERMHGMPKASVLPEPVSATPMTSRPERRNGQAAAWMGVGDLKVAKGEIPENFVLGRCEKSMMGRRGAEDVGSVTAIKVALRKDSISDAGRAVRFGSSV